MTTHVVAGKVTGIVSGADMLAKEALAEGHGRVAGMRHHKEGPVF
jgi:hypothetical protein